MRDSEKPLLSDLAEQLAAASTSGETPGVSGADDPAVLVLGTPSEPASSLLRGNQDRRTFLARASALSLVIPGVGAALAACSPGGQGTEGDSTRRRGSSTGAARQGRQPHNSDSRLDSSLLEGGHHMGTSATGSANGVRDVTYHRFAPELPPPSAERKLAIHWHAREVPLRISDDLVIAAWTFEGDIPGPIVHCREGDEVEFTLTNDVDIPHSMDFHAAQIDPKQAFKSVPKGQSVSFAFKPKFAGAFMYHCGTAPVLMHIGSGMFGALIVSPRRPLPPAREFVLVQNEYYLADGAADGDATGIRVSDYQKMLATLPDFVCFNGRPSQYVREPIRVKVGDRVRFWVVSAGPSHACHFHVVGGQFDTVYICAPPANPLRGVQTFSVAPGGGMVFELVCDMPGEFPFVNHGFGHGQKGAMGIMIVEP